MTTLQAWELSRLFPTLGNRLCPTLNLSFTWELLLSSVKE